jgi:hypothetical protein
MYIMNASFGCLEVIDLFPVVDYISIRSKSEDSAVSEKTAALVPVPFKVVAVSIEY